MLLTSSQMWEQQGISSDQTVVEPQITVGQVLSVLVCYTVRPRQALVLRQSNGIHS